MDSISELSLLEIAGEDDSLLSDATSTATNIFSCSPLLSSRSRPPLTEGREGGAADSEDLISSPKDGANKENANWSKLEVPKLSVETQQMKRKKKVGGYNLRKSLAWDRAFFTEQGVLNPLELSMISGTTTPNAKSNLEVINEEEPTTSIALQEIEENLFKHSSEGIPIGDRRTGARIGLSPKPKIGLSPKPGALTKQTPSPASLAKRKVFAVNDVVGNRSKRSACPRPVPSSSLKRANTAKTPGKELKITRTGGPKSDISANTTTVRSGTLTTGSSKKIQSTHPVTNVQKYAGVKGLSKIPRIVPSNTKSDMADKCSVTRTLTKKTGKHLPSQENAVSKAHSQSILHQPGSANKVSEACLSRGVLDVGEKKQQAVFQTTKSSGLRMPSPSLGFFTQAKASSSHGHPQKISIPRKPSENNIPIPKLRKLEKVSGKEARSKIVEGAAKNCTKELSLLDESEPSMQTDNNQMAGVELECDSLGLGKISKQAKVENIFEHVNFKSKEQGELHENENVSSMEKAVFPRHENKLLLKSHTHEQVEKEDDHPDVTKTVQRGSMQGIPCKNTEKVNGDAGDFDKCGGDAQVPLLDGNLSINCNETTQSNLDAINQQLQEGQLKTPDPIIVGEISSKREDKSLVNSCQLVHVTTLFSKGSPKKSILEINDASESESKIAEIKDCQLLVDDGQSGFIPKRSMDEEYDQVIDSKEMHVRTFELERSSEDFVTVSATACCTKVTDFSPKRPFSENDIEDLCLASKLYPSVQADCDSKGNDISINNSSPISVPQLRDDNFSRDAAIHYDVQRDIPGKFEQQASMFRDPEINEMPCKDESLVPNHCQLLHQSEFSEVSAGLTSNAEYYIGSGAANPSSLLLHTPLAQSVQEFDPTTRHIEESHVEEAQTQSFSENPVAYDCSSEQCLAVTNNQFSLAVDNNINEDSHLSEFQKSGAVTIDSQNVNYILHLDNDCLPTNIAPFEEIKGKKLVEDAFEGCSIHASEHNASNHQIQAMPEDGEGNHDVGERAEVLLIDDAKKGASDILPLVEVQRNDNILHFNGDCLPTNIAPFEEIKGKFLVEDAFEGCSIHASEHNASNHQIQTMPEDGEGNRDVDERAEVLLIDVAKKGAFDILPLIEVQRNDNILHFNGDCLPINIASSEEIKEKSLLEGAIEGCSIHTSEHNASDHHIQAKPENKDGNHVDEGAERLQVDDGERGSLDILPSVEVQVNDGISSAEFDSSVEVSENPVTMVVAWKHEEQSSLSKNPELPASHDATFNATNPQGSEVSPLNSKSFSDEAETNIFEKDMFPNTDMQRQIEGDINSAEDSSKIIHLEKISTKSTQEVPTVKPPPNAAPFSDEWLAAIEAAGEEILTKKSGAVQNSPPDKNQQELGPWSPVKKNQAIGPFDCTKHNLQHSGS